MVNCQVPHSSSAVSSKDFESSSSSDESTTEDGFLSML